MDKQNFHAFIEKVKELNDLADVVREEGVELGKDLKALCPFHNEANGSFSIKDSEGYWHCFGCGLGGDVINFIMLKRGMGFMGAFQYLAQRVNLEMPNLSPGEKERIENERGIEDVLTASVEYYHSQITESVKKWLKDKGIESESIEKFKLGYANGGLRNHLVDAYGFPVDLCVEAGVLKKKEDGSVVGRYYKRIIFPVLKNGRAVFLICRSIDEDKRFPKYLNLPRPITNFYNEQALKGTEVCLVEGPTDCISLEQWGFPSVAIIGNNVQDETRLSKLDHCEKINLCLDGDAGGRLGVEEIGKLLPDKVRVIELPEGQDANDYCLTHTSRDFQKLVDNAKGIIPYLMEKISSETDKTELPKKLEAILVMLSRMQKAKVEAHLNEIKSYFDLNARELDGYREHIKDLQKKQRKEEKNKQREISQDDRDSPTPIAIFPGLVDLAEYEGEVVFLVREQDKLTIYKQYLIENKTCVPPPKDKIPWLLPRGEKVLAIYDSQKMLSDIKVYGKLFDDLVVYFKSVSHLPSDSHYDFLSAWILHTYLLESVQYSPIVCLFAVPERGKSRTGKGIIYLAYRGIYVESLREAYLLRVAHYFGSALFFDVKDIWKKAEKYGSEDIILLRFEKGARVPRVLYPDKGPFSDTVYFSIFGPTVIATNEAPDQILETRAVTIVMPEANKRFENNVTPETSLELKERLLAFRGRCLGKELTDVPKPANSRLGDILKPIMQILHLVKPETIPQFLQLIKELDQDRSNERGNSLEAELLSILLGFREEILNGRLAVKLITDKLNAVRLTRYDLTYQFIGRRLGAMGFKKCSIGNGCAAILWDEKLIEALKMRYGVEEPQKPQKHHIRLKVHKTPQTS